MIKSVIDTIQKYKLLSKNDKLIVGVSGGPDSICLLRHLNSFKKKYSLNINVVHLDHGIRDGSYKDLKFVKKVCENLRIPFYSKQINLKEISQSASLEQEARIARLAYFSSLAKRLKIKKLALGHNLDDQAETILMRVIRGSGLYGLSGILPERKISNLTVIRPLIETKRKEIEKYLKNNKFSFVIDETNKKNLFLRNRVRNRLLPLLEEYNPKIKESLNILSQNASLDYELLEKIALKYFKRFRLKTVSHKKTSFNLERIAKLHPALIRMLVRLSYKNCKGDLRKLEYRHFKEIEDLIFKRPNNSIVNLPAKVTARKINKRIIFSA
jgi:tRNA(Ile)-lysidine synthase